VATTTTNNDPSLSKLEAGTVKCSLVAAPLTYLVEGQIEQQLNTDCGGSFTQDELPSTSDRNPLVPFI
jgi:hypothetical protein